MSNTFEVKKSVEEEVNKRTEINEQAEKAGFVYMNGNMFVLTARKLLLRKWEDNQKFLQ